MKPLISVYVPYYVPIAYKKDNDKIYVTTISILRGTSVSIYSDFKGLDINCQLSEPIKTILDKLYDTVKEKMGIVIAVDAPPFWEIGVQTSVILGMYLALKGLSTKSLSMKKISSEIVRMIEKIISPSWILHLNFSKGLTKFTISNNGLLENHNMIPIKDNMRIVIGVKASNDFPGWIKEININEPDEEITKILGWTPNMNLSYHWNNMDVKIVSLQKLRSTIEDIINSYTSEEIIISQPDNIGVRIYRF